MTDGFPRSTSPPPKRILLQWHVTERCNLHCRHCYQAGHRSNDLPLDILLTLLEQFDALLESWGSADHHRPIRGHITLTGGEPFLRPDFIALLRQIAGRRDRYSFAVLTNGMLIDRELARLLSRLRPTFVQVSMEGTRATHDRIRGAGNLARVEAAIRHLVRARVCTMIAFTAHRSNYREFPDVARRGRNLGVHTVWADRLIPAGQGAAMADQVLDAEQTRTFLNILAESRRRFTGRWFSPTRIATHRALQFLATDTVPYACTAGRSLITLLPNGDLVPCRRMPIPVGNALRTPLAGLYHDSPVLQALRDPTRVSAGCGGCPHQPQCRGGLKCLAYGTTGDAFRADPGCWLAQRVASGSGV